MPLGEEALLALSAAARARERAFLRYGEGPSEAGAGGASAGPASWPHTLSASLLAQSSLAASAVQETQAWCAEASACVEARARAEARAAAAEASAGAGEAMVQRRRFEGATEGEPPMRRQPATRPPPPPPRVAPFGSAIERWPAQPPPPPPHVPEAPPSPPLAARPFRIVKLSPPRADTAAAARFRGGLARELRRRLSRLSASAAAASEPAREPPLARAARRYSQEAAPGDALSDILRTLAAANAAPSAARLAAQRVLADWPPLGSSSGEEGSPLSSEGSPPEPVRRPPPAAAAAPDMPPPPSPPRPPRLMRTWEMPAPVLTPDAASVGDEDEEADVNAALEGGVNAGLLVGEADAVRRQLAERRRQLRTGAKTESSGGGSQPTALDVASSIVARLRLPPVHLAG